MENMNEEYGEYIVFAVTDKNGNEVEMAVVDEFEVDGKSYVAAGLIEGDTISEDGVYIYRVKDGEDFDVEKIENEEEYEKVAEAYMADEEVDD